MNPTNITLDAKCLINKRSYDTSIQSNLKLWPYKVISREVKKPMIIITQRRRKIVCSRRNFFNGIDQGDGISLPKKTVKNVVVIVPAYFNKSHM
eukprot:Gb_39389 [translate_table: standard]